MEKRRKFLFVSLTELVGDIVTAAPRSDSAYFAGKLGLAETD